MTAIKNITALEILDSRGCPTLQVKASLENGVSASACVPSGASTGSREACELRDNDPSRYGGKGVLKAIDNVNGEIHRLLKGQEAGNQSELDRLMCEADGTALKQRLGANAILGTSLAVARAAAADAGLPLYRYFSSLGQQGQDEQLTLPVPMMNILNGGAHASNNLDIQEFMVQPYAAESFAEALRWGAEIFHALRSLLKQRGLSTAVGDEGGVAPDLADHKSALELIFEAVHSAGFKPGSEVGLALDCAATEFYRDGKYHLDGENRHFGAQEFALYLEELCNAFPITSIEDGMAEDDWEGWAVLSEVLGERLQLVGDDLFVTDSAALQRGIEQNIANAVLVKFNQVGTLSETLEVICLAREAGYGRVISHRSGETGDTTIADLAVATAAGQIKTGAPCRSDRVEKYNRLLAIEAELGKRGRYSGKNNLSLSLQGLKG